MFSFCLFSSVDGCITHHGIPIEEAIVERIHSSAWFDGDTKKSDTTVSDREGKFHFDPIFAPWSIDRIFAWLPHEPVVNQKILITVNDISYVAWIHSKHTYMIDGELALWDERIHKTIPRRIIISCELENPEKRHEPYEVYGIGEIVPLESSSSNPLFPTVLV